MDKAALLEQQLQYRNAVIRVLDAVRPIFSESEAKEVLDLIHHNENGEALRTLAFIIEEENKSVPISVLEQIGHLASGSMSRDDMPKQVQGYMNEP